MQTALFGIFAAMAANHLPAVFAATCLSNVVSLIHVTIVASLVYSIIKNSTFFGCVATSALRIHSKYPRPEETGFYGTEG